MASYERLLRQLKKAAAGDELGDALEAVRLILESQERRLRVLTRAVDQLTRILHGTIERMK